MKRVVLAFVLSLLLFSINNAQECLYLPGDINSDSQTIGGDVTYGVRYLKGIGPAPKDSCFMDSTSTFLYVAADVNGNCEFRGSDITRLVAYFKGNAELSYCHFFPPPEVLPVLTTAAISGVTQTTAECGGNITSDGGSAVIARGVCWSTDSIPTITNSKTTDGTGVGSFASSITGLTLGTHYYFRAYATNSAGTSYGNVLSFTTTDSMGTVTDIDGNTYITVKICNQWWMAENLKVTHYSNGDALPNVTDSLEWYGLSTGAYCSNHNDTTNVSVYGRLYNWHAVNDSRNIAPAGWHVPTDAEWKQLEMCLGMSQGEADSWAWRGTNEGGKMKTVGTIYWDSPNTGATNESGFSGLPGGCRDYDGRFLWLRNYAIFWSSTAFNPTSAMGRFLSFEYSSILRNRHDIRDGFSIRCVKD
jgi:uncharacterized protein (TIGR02145 family)